MSEPTHGEVLVVTTDNRGLHIYSNLKSIFADEPIGFGGDVGVPVELFKADGRRVLIGFGSKWQPVSLHETADEADPEMLLQRLRAVVENMADHVRVNADALLQAGLQPEDALKQIPSLHNVGLKAAIEACRPRFGHTQESDRRDPWHNFWAHGIF